MMLSLQYAVLEEVSFTSIDVLTRFNTPYAVI